MPRHVVLLRGINVGPHNRIAMPALREALAEAGFSDVATYVQSGNIVLGYAASPAGLAADIERLLVDRFALEVPVVTRTREELAAVVRHNPFPTAAQESPKHYQVTFLSEVPSPELLERIAALAVAGEEFSAHAQELYAVHRAGIQGSKLANALTPKKLGVRCATARNWTTVTALLEMASDGE